MFERKLPNGWRVVNSTEDELRQVPEIEDTSLSYSWEELAPESLNKQQDQLNATDYIPNPELLTVDGPPEEIALLRELFILSFDQLAFRNIMPKLQGNSYILVGYTEKLTNRDGTKGHDFGLFFPGHKQLGKGQYEQALDLLLKRVNEVLVVTRRKPVPSPSYNLKSTS